MDGFYVAGALGALAELVQDRSNEYHGADTPKESSALGQMLEDLGRVSFDLGGQPQPEEPREEVKSLNARSGSWVKHYQADYDLIAEFDRYSEFVDLAETALDDPYPYYRPTWQATQRDDHMLALAALEALAEFIVRDDEDGKEIPHRLRREAEDLRYALWLNPTETREVTAMRDTLVDAVKARSKPRKNPLPPIVATVAPLMPLEDMLAAILANAPMPAAPVEPAAPPAPDPSDLLNAALAGIQAQLAQALVGAYGKDILTTC